MSEILTAEELAAKLKFLVTTPGVDGRHCDAVKAIKASHEALRGEGERLRKAINCFLGCLLINNWAQHTRNGVPTREVRVSDIKALRVALHGEEAGGD